jgi:uncharacterized membrane protein YccF (DUF307 family)
MNKKNVMIMRNNRKNNETKLPPLGININFWLRLAGLAVVVGLIYACGASFTTVVGIYLGYKLLRLILRFFGLVFSLFFTLVSIVILIAIISLLIF